MTTIGWILARTQPAALVELVTRRLLSTATVRELAGLDDAGETESRTYALMPHDSYRRVRGRLVQVRRGA